MSNILTLQAQYFIEQLMIRFGGERETLLENRKGFQELFDAGGIPAFSKETVDIRNSADWKIGPIPDSIKDRRVEITGPPDRKMAINALNSGASVYMADFEDSLSPTWNNVIDGQINLKDAVNGIITYEHPTKGTYKLNKKPAVLFVRPRGLHLEEKNFEVNEKPWFS